MHTQWLLRLPVSGKVGPGGSSGRGRGVSPAAAGAQAVDDHSGLSRRRYEAATPVNLKNRRTGRGVAGDTRGRRVLLVVECNCRLHVTRLRRVPRANPTAVHSPRASARIDLRASATTRREGSHHGGAPRARWRHEGTQEGTEAEWGRRATGLRATQHRPSPPSPSFSNHELSLRPASSREGLKLDYAT